MTTAEGEEIVGNVLRPVERMIVDLGDEEVAAAENWLLCGQIARVAQVRALPDEDLVFAGQGDVQVGDARCRDSAHPRERGAEGVRL